MSEQPDKAVLDRNLWSARLPYLAGYGAVLVLLVTLGWWSVGTQIAGAVIASGTVRVEANRQVVQHPDGGVVGEILVREGDIVQEDDVLVRLDGTFLRSELAIIERQLLETTARQVRLSAERDDIETPDFSKLQVSELVDPVWAEGQITGQRNLFVARRTSLTAETDQLSERARQVANQIQGIEAELAAMRRQHKLLSEELDDQTDLFERGLTVASRVLQLQREEARLDGEIGRLVASVAEQKGEIAAIEIQTIQLRDQRREDAIGELRDLRFNEIDLEERRLSLIEQLARLDIRAPMAGRVFGTRVFTVKSVVTAAEPLMYVVPEDQPMEVVAKLDPSDVEHVWLGQDVSLRFSTYDQRVIPEIAGTVLRRSADTMTDEQTGISYYEVVILPDPNAMADASALKMLPGLPVEAFIQTAERTPLSYLTQPLASYFERALRES